MGSSGSPRNLPLALAFAGCVRVAPVPDSDVDTVDPAGWQGIVVVWTLDTLGATAANEAGFCEDLGARFAARGLALACVPGAISPSSWTAPAHARLLWPEHGVPPFTNRDAPRCDAESALGRIARAHAATYVFGADNATLGPVPRWTCADERSTFVQDADVAFTEGVITEPVHALVPEDERPVHFALDAVEAGLARGDGLVVFLNSFEVGGHRPPRCAETPYSRACDDLWTYAVRAGLVDATDDRQAAWLDERLLVGLEPQMVEDFDRNPLGARAMLWGSMHDTIATYRGPMFEQRVERLLDAVQDAGRLDDLVFVALGDHGESPGQLATNGKFNPSHGGQPNEWTAPVPVYVAPAARVDAWRDAGLVATDGAWWSAANLVRALVRDAGVEEPASWPAPEPVGAAWSWACNDFRDPSVGATGIYVTAEGALRCQDATCETTTFALPVDLDAVPSPLVTSAFDALAAAPNAFVMRCANPPPP